MSPIVLIGLIGGALFLAKGVKKKAYAPAAEPDEEPSGGPDPEDPLSGVFPSPPYDGESPVLESGDMQIKWGTWYFIPGTWEANNVRSERLSGSGGTVSAVRRAAGWHVAADGSGPPARFRVEFKLDDSPILDKLLEVNP